MDPRENRVKPEDVEREIGAIRHGMEPVLDELRRRRHRLTDWKYQLRHRSKRIGKGAALFGGLVAAVRFFQHRRKQRSQTA